MSIQSQQTIETKPLGQGGIPNFDLVFPRLEREILDGRKPELCRQVLDREDIWKNVEPSRQLKWARLAQMAGEAETALKVLAHINKETPHLKGAWEDRLGLLSILDREQDLIAALGIARAVFGEDQWREWAGTYGKRQVTSGDGVADAAVLPFERLKRRQELLLHYLDLFSGREDCFARQWADKAQAKQGYVPVRRGMEILDVEEHLSGRKTYGIYLVRYDGTVRLAVLDVDLRQEYRGGKLKADDRSLVQREWAYLYSRVRDLSRGAGIEPLVEFSGGKGFHFWFLLAAPVPPEQVRRALGEIRDALAPDLKAFNLEVFPKQEKLSGKGLGNLVKLPLGIHRLTGKRSYFLRCADRSTEAQIEYLMQVKSSGAEELLKHVEKGKREKVLPHPRLQKWSDDFPELSTLETRCPPLGQIIASCRQGKALSNTEERVLFQTVGFLRRTKTLMHHLTALMPEYNPHLVDFKLTRLRGTPLGCRRIHSVLGFTADLCAFERKGEYDHPLLHLDEGGIGHGSTRMNTDFYFVLSVRIRVDPCPIRLSVLQSFRKPWISLTSRSAIANDWKGLESAPERIMNTSKLNESNIVLIGMPGSGKSTVGVILAKLTSRGFVDTDVLIQTFQHRSLQEIVDSEGYMGLRKIEEKVLLGLHCKSHVIATGGSAIYSHAAMEHLKSSGIAVFLKVDLQTLESRITDFDSRGIAKSPEQSFSDLFQERWVLYSRYAEIVVECMNGTHEQVCTKIIDALKLSTNSSSPHGRPAMRNRTRRLGF